MIDPRVEDRVATGVIWVMVALIVSTVAGLVGYVLVKGAGYLDWGFLTRPPEVMSAGGGVGPLIFNSLYLVLLTLAFTTPIGIGAGLYLSEYAGNGKFPSGVRLSVQALASMPSIVIGLFGLLVFVNATGWGYSLLSGALAVSLLSLPVVVSVTEESLSSVPRELREASYALGATKWETVWNVVMPAAFPGIATGIIIVAGRAFGEAAALLYTAGMTSPALDFGVWNPLNPESPLSAMRPAETLAVHIWKTNSEGLVPDASRIANGSSAILIIAVLAFNVLSRYGVRRMIKRMTAS